MKKSVIVFIISIFTTAFIFFACGFFLNQKITKSSYNKDFEIQRLNNLVIELENNLIRKDNEISDLYEKIQKYDNCICGANEYIHPIKILERKCIKESTNAADTRNCIYKSESRWRKEIVKYMQKLKASTIDEEYKIIEKSQNLWIKQNKKDQEIIEHFVLNHGGTMYYDLAASDNEELVENRANFLNWIYEVHNNNIESDF